MELWNFHVQNNDLNYSLRTFSKLFADRVSCTVNLNLAKNIYEW